MPDVCPRSQVWVFFKTSNSSICIHTHIHIFDFTTYFMSIVLCLPVCLVPTGMRSRSWILWKWSEGWLWVAVWVWGIKPRSLGRAVSALHRWAVSQPSSSLWFLDTLFCVKHEQETTNKKAPSHFVLIFFPFLWNKATLCKGKDSEYLGTVCQNGHLPVHTLKGSRSLSGAGRG